MTTNLPFARWSKVFLDRPAAAAVIDRISPPPANDPRSGPRGVSGAAGRLEGRQLARRLRGPNEGWASAWKQTDAMGASDGLGIGVR